MSDINTGGQAFPDKYTNGMTLRDYFAAKAMHAILSNPEFGDEETDIAETAYWAADAMLKAREV